MGLTSLLASFNVSGSSGPEVTVNIRLEAFLSTEEAGSGLVSKAPGVTCLSLSSLQHRSCITFSWGGDTLTPELSPRAPGGSEDLGQDPLDGWGVWHWLRALPRRPSLGHGGTAFALKGSCSYFPGKDKPLSWAQRGAARPTARSLSSGPRPAPWPFPSSLCIFPDECCKPTVYIPMVLGRAQLFPLLETWSQDESQPKGRGWRERRQSQNCGGQSVGSQGDTKVSAP